MTNKQKTTGHLVAAAADKIHRGVRNAYLIDRLANRLASAKNMDTTRQKRLVQTILLELQLKPETGTQGAVVILQQLARDLETK